MKKKGKTLIDDQHRCGTSEIRETQDPQRRPHQLKQQPGRQFRNAEEQKIVKRTRSLYANETPSWKEDSPNQYARLLIGY